MKPSLTTESTGVFFEPPASAAEVVSTLTHVTVTPGAIERTDSVARDGLSIALWAEALPMWRSALAQLPGATLYHSERWLEALRSCYPIDLRVATFHRMGELRAAGIFALSKGWFSTRLVGIPFSDSGEPLAIDDAARADFLSALAASRQASSIEIRGAMGPASWSNVDCFAHWTLDLNRPYSEIYAGFSRNVRNGIKRGRKDGIQIDRGTGIDYVNRFFGLQLETRRRLGVPPQPLKFFATVHEKFSRGGDCETWFATLDGRDVAGLILIREGDLLYYKWGARGDGKHQGANHLLVVKMIEEFAGKARLLDLGRCDSRNEGLVRSKTDLGCTSRPLPYAFFPAAPRRVSSEVLSGPAKVMSSVWKKLPLPVTRVLGEAMYRYLA